MKIFISYRRDDSTIHAKLIHDELARRFGADDVFMDIEDIDYGEDFARRIDERLDAADVVVAVIGPHWADMLQQRVHGDDYVRHELARALARGIRIVPVLVDQAPPPGAGLPGDLAGLRTLNALALDQRALKPHLNALVEAVQGRSFEDVARGLQRRIRSQWLAQCAGAGVGLVTFFAAWVALLDFVGLDTRLASATMALAGARSSAPWSGEVVLVAIDEGTVRTVGRPFGASWRREHARLIGQLAAAGARSVAFDLFIERPGPPTDDQALEHALREASPLPVAFAIGQSEGALPALLPRLAALASAGIACVGQKLGYARSMPLAVQRGQALLPSLALAAYSGGGKVEAIEERRPSLRVRLLREQRSPDLPYSLRETARTAQADCEAIRPGDRVALQLLDPYRLPELRSAPRRLPYERLLDAGDAAARAAVKGKIVLVGLQLANTDVTVLPGGDTRWGMELIGEQIDALVRGEVIRIQGPASSLATMALAALVGAFLRRAVSERPRAVRVLLAAAGMFACAATSLALYRWQQVLVSLAYVLLAFLLAWLLMARLDRRGMR